MTNYNYFKDVRETEREKMTVEEIRGGACAYRINVYRKKWRAWGDELVPVIGIPVVGWTPRACERGASVEECDELARTYVDGIRLALQVFYKSLIVADIWRADMELGEWCKID